MLPKTSDRYLRSLLRSKSYGPNHATGTRWTIDKRVRAPKDLLLLGHNGSDRVVFRFHLPVLSPKMCPEDKFVRGKRAGEALLREMARACGVLL